MAKRVGVVPGERSWCLDDILISRHVPVGFVRLDDSCCCGLEIGRPRHQF